ncbi:hypothetical protein M5K25_022298 [Dendrobium thyrsiflorum]|uniref:CCHC-type domain-containing protein n=1 Tax=Dendrobium thyrsiflorum TaxID=117978 RepID=A0ABD0U630_DENTH
MGLSCFNCGKIGHRMEQCPSNVNQGNGNGLEKHQEIVMLAGVQDGTHPRSTIVGKVPSVGDVRDSTLMDRDLHGKTYMEGESSKLNKIADKKSSPAEIDKEGNADQDENERLFGPWNLVPPSRSRSNHQETRKTDQSVIIKQEYTPRQVDLEKVKKPVIPQGKEKYKPTWKEKRMEIKQPLMFTVGVQQPKASKS